MDSERLNNELSSVETSVKMVEEISDTVVNGYSQQLDDLMNEIKVNVVDIDYPGTDMVEKYYIKLSSLIYFVVEKVEKLGIYDDVSKARFKEAYNTSYINGASSLVNGKKPTAGELTSMSEINTVYEATVNSVYNRSYKMFKAKVEAAQTMVSTLSKIVSKRMNELQFSGVNDGKQILNEVL